MATYDEESRTKIPSAESAAGPALALTLKADLMVLRLYRALKAAMGRSPHDIHHIASQPRVSSETSTALGPLSDEERTLLQIAHSNQNFSIVPASYETKIARNRGGLFDFPAVRNKIPDADLTSSATFNKLYPKSTSGRVRLGRFMEDNVNLDKEFRKLKQSFDEIESAGDIDIAQLREINERLSSLLDTAQSTHDRLTKLNEKLDNGMARFRALVNSPE